MSEDERTEITVLENKEECLEALCRLEKAHKITSALNLAENSDLEGKPLASILLDLVLAKTIVLKDKEICLTKKGRAIGKNIIRKHELAERMLLLFGLQKAAAHKEACKLEHTLSNMEIAELDLRMAALEKILAQKIISLDKAEIDKTYKISLLSMGKMATRRLEDLGLGQGSTIRVCNLQAGGPVEIEAHGACTALGHALASKILLVPEIKTLKKKD